MANNRARRLSSAGKVFIIQAAVLVVLFLLSPGWLRLRQLCLAAGLAAQTLMLALHFLNSAWVHTHTEWKPSGAANYSPEEWRPATVAEDGAKSPSWVLKTFGSARIANASAMTALLALVLLRLLGACIGRFTGTS